MDRLKFGSTELLESSNLRAQAPVTGLRTIFVGAEGLRAGWRFLIYILGFVVLTALSRLVVNHFPALAESVRKVMVERKLTPEGLLVFEAAGIIAVAVPAAIMARIERRGWGVYGLPFENAFGKLFWQGVLWGLAFETIEMALIVALGGFSLGAVALPAGALLKSAAVWAFVFLLVGLQEEFKFRGYTQFTLATGMGFWPAALLLSAFMGAISLTNPAGTWIGGVEAAVWGLFACLTLRRTGNLWFAIGFRAALDFAETFLYGVPDAGLLPTGQLFNSTLHGAKWITGGSAGPQESAMAFVLFAAAFVIFPRLYPGQVAVTSSAGPAR